MKKSSFVRKISISNRIFPFPHLLIRVECSMCSVHCVCVYVNTISISPPVPFTTNQNEWMNIGEQQRLMTESNFLTKMKKEMKHFRNIHRIGGEHPAISSQCGQNTFLLRVFMSVSVWLRAYVFLNSFFVLKMVCHLGCYAAFSGRETHPSIHQTKANMSDKQLQLFLWTLLLYSSGFN